MLKKIWDKPELMTILTKETEHGATGDHMDDDYTANAPTDHLCFS